MKNLSIIFLAIAFTQVVSAETLPELLEDFNSIIENRVSEVGQLIGLIGKEIGQTYGEIDKNIKESASNLKNAIDNIENLINVSISRAEELNQNVDDCVSAARSTVSTLTIDALQKCGLSNELINVQKLMPKISVIPRQLGTLIPKCMTGIQNAATLRTCLGQGLERIENDVNSLNSDARTLIENAVEAARSCIDSTKADIDNAISNITNTLNDCVNSELNG
ncbi:uncharacterized protein LOC123684925 [Harmonia axyridis]|uniref:uncharacterized protein LOC123684925 n=1 Tax=Harmonia axyridis TaxID=115357 RepID=UPI001E275F7E|nr:uncharacterized protein LOC123684925 [Harmonia axyridis]